MIFIKYIKETYNQGHNIKLEEYLKNEKGSVVEMTKDEAFDLAMLFHTRGSPEFQNDEEAINLCRELVETCDGGLCCERYIKIIDKNDIQNKT